MKKRVKTLLKMSVAMTFGSIVITAQASSPANRLEKSRPLPVEPARYLENYAFLSDPDKRTDFFDPIRYIPLGSSSWLQLGGGIRLRYENQANPIAASGAVDNDTFLQQRYQVHGDAHLFGDAMRIFVQLEDTESSSKQVFTPFDQSDTEIHQVFADFAVSTYGKGKLTLRAGRQEMNFGTLVTSTYRNGPNVRLTFDGFRLEYTDPAGYGFNAFAVQPVTAVEKGSFNDSSSGGGDFFGLYATVPVTRSVETDLYAFGRDRDVRALNGILGKENRKTLGIRPNGHMQNIDFSVDAIYQFGDHADQDIQAWALSSSVGYTLRDVAWKPSAALRFDAASGDDDPNDSETNTFDPLFSSSGALYGDATAVATLSNLIAVGPKFAFVPRPDLIVSPTVLGLWRQTKNDSAYQPGVIPIPGTMNAGGNRLGTSYELFTRWTPTANLTFDLIYQYYDVSGPLREVGLDDAQYVAIRSSFKF